MVNKKIYWIKCKLLFYLQKKVDRSIHVEVKGSKRNKQAGPAATAGLGAAGSGEDGAFRQKQFEQMQWEQQLRMREEELSRWERDEYMRRANEDR